MSLNVKLVVVGGDVKTTEIKLKLPSTIGRGRGTTIVLPHPLVSRQHCELFEAAGQLMVKDLGSLNGTFVNNERVTESPLAPDELLTVGTVTFRAVYETAASHSAGSTLKTGPSEKTLPAPKATTFAASPKPAASKTAPKPAAPQPANSDSEPLEFNFEEPLLPVDEALTPTKGSAVAPTERLDATVAQDKKPASPPAAAAKNAKTPAKPAATRLDDSDEDGSAPSTSDDDLNDFLESLGDKDK
jgi:pSer/pThr/pTyr-binding forkhead associated (FHA) protein